MNAQPNIDFHDAAWLGRAADVPITRGGSPNPFEQDDNADLPQIAKPQELTELRLKLRANGYDPLPVIGAHIVDDNAGKRPTMTDWQNQQNIDPARIASWSQAQPNNTSTGILCGEIVGVDIDVRDADLSARLAARAQELFGPSMLRRIGRAPKVLLAYRVETPHEKLTTPTSDFW